MKDALALVPPVVVADELRSGLLIERCSIPQWVETFYAITVQRRFPHPLLREILQPGRTARTPSGKLEPTHPNAGSRPPPKARGSAAAPGRP
jgi:hypothetical protein